MSSAVVRRRFFRGEQPPVGRHVELGVIGFAPLQSGIGGHHAGGRHREIVAARVHGDAHEVAGARRAVQELASSRVPDRFGAAVHRHLEAMTELWEGLRVDLVVPRLVGDVGDPSAVWQTGAGRSR